MNAGERLKQFRQKLGLTQKELAEKLGFKWYKIKDMESNKQKITYEIAKDLEKLFSINPDWLLTGEGEMYKGNERLQKARELLNNIENNHEADVVNVPFYEDIYASAGAGAYNETVSPTNNLTFSTNFLRNMLNILDYQGLHIITAVGDSMQPTICDGDRLFVLPLKDHNINDGGVYVISTPFGVLVKRVYIYPVEQKMILHSDNPEIKDEILEGEVMEKIKFVGRVVGILRNRI